MTPEEKLLEKFKTFVRFAGSASYHNQVYSKHIYRKFTAEEKKGLYEFLVECELEHLLDSLYQSDKMEF